MPGDKPHIRTHVKTLEAMIRIYCRGRHRKNSGICPECSELLEYAAKRLETCPFQEKKPRCSKCPVHCYKPDMRARIIDVMRYAGPHMLYRHPFLAAGHYLGESRRGWTEE